MSKPERVTFLMHGVDGIGGVARTVVNLANELVTQRPVDIISLRSQLRGPVFTPDPRIRVTYLDRAEQRTWRHRLPFRRDTPPAPALPKPAFRGQIEPELDLRVQQAVAAVKDGILISTRPSLHSRVVQHAAPDVITIGQEHLNFITRQRNRKVMESQREALQGLDALVVLTQDDRTDYEALVPGAKARVVTIPNGTSFPMGAQATLQNKVAISAGRFAIRKGFVRLVEAWAPLADEFPDWELHIYGKGPERRNIVARIKELGVGHSVKVKPYSTSFDQVLLDCSAYLMASNYEGFPMVLVEAMSKGLPLVAFDCPRGPADVIEDGVNGRLVPDDDIPGYTEALRQVLADDALRHSMGNEGFERAKAYEMPAIAQRWVQLFEELRAARG